MPPFSKLLSITQLSHGCGDLQDISVDCLKSGLSFTSWITSVMPEKRCKNTESDKCNWAPEFSHCIEIEFCIVWLRMMYWQKLLLICSYAVFWHCLALIRLSSMWIEAHFSNLQIYLGDLCETIRCLGKRSGKQTEKIAHVWVYSVSNHTNF